MSNITVEIPLIALADTITDAQRSITITGDQRSVCHAVARISGLNPDGADLRPCAVHDGELVIVDAAQADSYPAFLALEIFHSLPRIVIQASPKNIQPPLSEYFSAREPRDREVARR